MDNVTITRVAGTVMNVNSYLVESDDSIVVVDGMLTVSDARSVRARIDERRKPLRGLVVTHAHPGAEWPGERRFPDRVVQGHVELGDLTFRVKDLGAGESPADSLWSLDERRLFVGDLVYNGMHAYLADGHYQEWLAQLAALEATLDRDAVYVGHGEPAGRELLSTQRRYVEAFVDAVQAHLNDTPDARRAAVGARMKALLPTDGLYFLMELSVDPVAAALGAT